MHARVYVCVCVCVVMWSPVDTDKSPINIYIYIYMSNNNIYDIVITFGTHIIYYTHIYARARLAAAGIGIGHRYSPP
jgi:hypothetical protein